jgi:ferritin-like protein
MIVLILLFLIATLIAVDLFVSLCLAVNLLAQRGTKKKLAKSEAARIEAEKRVEMAEQRAGHWGGELVRVMKQNEELRAFILRDGEEESEVETVEEWPNLIEG